MIVKAIQYKAYCTVIFFVNVCKTIMQQYGSVALTINLTKPDKDNIIMGRAELYQIAPNTYLMQFLPDEK